MKKKIIILSTNRADYDHLFWLYKDLKKNKKFEIFFLISNKIQTQNDKIKKKNVRLSIKGDKPNDIINIISNSIKTFSKEFSKIKPDLVILLGDRYEILSAAIAASILKTPIAHLNGGEITLGAYDNWIRHSITKMASLHFVANNFYKKRVIQLGEDFKTVKNVGGLSMDNILKTKLLDTKELESQLKIKLKKKNLLITYHPETLENNTIKEFKNLLSVLKNLKNTFLIFTKPNFDTDNKIIYDLTKNFVKKNKNSKIFNSLGRVRYLSLAKKCDMIVGNSSSGLLEMPYLNKISINIGERQHGRNKEQTVIDAKANKNQIYKAIKIGYSRIKNSKKFKLNYFYGKGDAAQKISSILNNHNFKFNLKKEFKDIK